MDPLVEPDRRWELVSSDEESPLGQRCRNTKIPDPHYRRTNDLRGSMTWWGTAITVGKYIRKII